MARLIPNFKITGLKVLIEMERTDNTNNSTSNTIYFGDVYRLNTEISVEREEGGYCTSEGFSTLSEDECPRQVGACFKN